MSILEEIWKLEQMLHRIKGQSNKHQERKAILAELEKLNKKFKEDDTSKDKSN
jgi:hypothetical protein